MKNQPAAIISLAILCLGGLLLVGSGIYLSQPARYESMARVALYRERIQKFEISHTIIGAREPATTSFVVWVEGEKIQSKDVLSRVIANLDLQTKWAKRAGLDKPMTFDTVYAQLRNQVSVRQQGSNSVIEIMVRSHDKGEAATVANEIGHAYIRRDHEHWQERRAAGIRAFEEQAKVTEKEQTETAVLVRKLATELNVTEATVTTRTNDAIHGEADPKKRQYLEAVRKAEILRRVAEVLRLRIEQEKLNAPLPIEPVVELLDKAEPALRPISPNRPLGLSIAAGGALLIGVGLLFRILSRKTPSTIAAPTPA
jgi:uncharacterized protein involved in exopolysaccharide biosynthesis